MTNNDTIEIRRRDMVTSCPIADDIKRLRDNNAYLLEELEKERAKVETLEVTLGEYKGSLVTARASRDAAEGERDHWYAQCTIAEGKVQRLKELLKSISFSSKSVADNIWDVLDDIS
jgi:hypothetical protein